MRQTLFAAACLLMVGCTTTSKSQPTQRNEEETMQRDTSPIVVQETYPAAPSEVWKAITDPAEMRKWYFEAIEAFEPEVGFETQFNVNAEGHDFLHLWKVKEVIPNRKLAYTFNYEGYDGEALVTWELSEVEDGTKLTVTHKGLHTFPQDMVVFTRESCEGGWTYFLGDSLKKYLNKKG